MSETNPSTVRAAQRRLRLALRLLIGLVLLGLVIWRLPRFVGAFVISGDLRRLDAAIALKPGDGEAVSQATVALMESISRWEGLDDSALTSRMAVQERATQANMHVGLARYHASRGQSQEALKAYQKAMATNADALSYAMRAEFYGLATQLDPTDGEARLQLIEYLELSGETQRAREVLLETVQNADAWDLSDAWVADAYYRLGMSYETEGNEALAVAQYRQAIELKGRFIAAMSRLVAIYVQADDAAQADFWERELAELDPEHAVGQSVGEGWYLVGYDLGEQALQDSLEVEISWYWVPESPYETSAPGWYRAGDRWVQVTTVRNLAFNGGFERGKAGGTDLPAGWYVTKDTVAELPARTLAERDGEITQVASLRGPGIVALCSEGNPSRPNATYLHSAWVRSDGATPADVGCVWNAAGMNAWTYIVQQVQSEEWTYFAGIASYPEEATGCRPCVYKRGEGGEVQFDDVLLIELELPGSGLGG